jgi:2-polyprenyl-3-methyl-5-hydroxy-6-metoxy-1,4-benzoquinol methylase
MAQDEYREHPCDLCGANDPVELPHSREYTNGQPVHVCRSCGFVYVIRRRSSERIAAAWSNEIFGAGYTAAIPAVTARLTYVAEFLNQHLGLRGKRVCEIGGGEGAFMNMMGEPRYGAEPFGIEPSPANGEKLRGLGIRHFTGTVEQFDAANQAGEAPFDIVVMLWTLENCQDCRQMLSMARRMLKPAGAVVVATGSRLLVPFKKPLHTYLQANPTDTHCFRFSANTLQGILAVSGFETAHVNRYLDHDILCVIGRPVGAAHQPKWQGDNFIDVCNFFERWHVDTAMYYPDRLV